MKLISLVIVLLCWQVAYLRQLAESSHVFALYLNFFQKTFGRQNWYQQGVGLALILVVAALIFVLINRLLSFSWLQLFFQVVVVFWIIVKLSNYTLEKLTPAMLPTRLSEDLLNATPPSVWHINYIWVTPFFWYLFTGLFGLIIYALLFFLQQIPGIRWQMQARLWLEFMAWIPARLLGLAYCLVGNMTAGLKMWGEILAAGIPLNAFFLEACAVASVQQKKQLTLEQSYELLVRDASILLLACYALLALLSWFM